MQKKILLLLISIFLCSALNAQEEKLIPAKKLRKDYKHLVSMVEAHPSPYRHISEENLDKLIDSTRNLLTEPMTILDFYKLASPVFSKIKDGHSSVNMPMKWLKKYREQNGVFPYKVFLSDDNRLYILQNYAEEDNIPVASEILSLNDVPMTAFIEKVSTYISYEQENFRNGLIEKRFDFYLLLYFGKISKIKLHYVSNEKQKEHLVNYIPYEQWKDEQKEADALRDKKVKSHQPYEYTKIKEGVGLLKIYSFAIKNQGKYDIFLRKMFRKIKEDKIESLIIDIRGNAGGFPKSVSDLLHYVSEKYFKTMAGSEMKVSKVYKEYFMNKAPSANFNRMSFHNSPHSIDLNALFAKKTGTLVREEVLYNEPPRKMDNEFTGDLYLLTDRNSYSASSSLAATFRCYQLGMIIGTETGGTSIFYANSMYKKLIHTDLICAMATTRLYTSCFNEADEGIKPDIEVIPTVQYLVNKNDIILNYTMVVINKVKKMKNKKGK